MKQEEISDLIKEKLRRLPIFDETHKIGVKRIDEEKLWVGYRTTEGNPRGTTRFDLNIIGDTCYILWIELDKEYRGENFGKSLFKIIEDFAKDYGCDKVRLTPSGQTISEKSRLEYMNSLGYHKVGIEMEKNLN
jgi:GNAT superfamily N-acetyltransferase